MKEALIDNNLRVKIHDVPIPTPGPGRLLIRTIVSGTNPKDWKMPKLWVPQASPSNYGDDLSGYIEAVGEGVLGFSKGDRVAAFHEMGAPHGSYAEYSIAWAHSAFHLPANITFEEAATIPLAAMTAALGLYQRLGLPLPWSTTTTPLPLVIYGGATAVGSFAIKLAALSNIHPIIAIAGNGTPYVNTLLDKSKGDMVIDYRQGEAHMLEKIKEAAGDNPIIYALDTVSEMNTLRTIDRALVPGKGKIANLLPSSPEHKLFSELMFTMVGTVHTSKSTKPWPALGDKEFGALFFSFFGRGLQEGWFHGHPYEVRTGGLDALGQILGDLEAGKNSAKKYLLKIAETKGVM
ncbi:Trans-enoyl reductase fsr4 [Colletotrichum gloeosporioides]|uniref:Trans-enoyl reductase fsr4 n=1 Tax=Colletotrichum gloeosporioides TaxID=474922 RepID=A0A8H4FKI7_COLGL|nr:Trans-enoyl reductase fsr4 [Colletotrichum gloeosporioides]KAF3805475.1 Trans-enoyl reductase fsr4 [Colletotrichum gloeosporioides]